MPQQLHSAAMDDALIQKVLAQALGDNFEAFNNTAVSDPFHHLHNYESILYTLGKRDLIFVLECLQAFSTTVSPRIVLHSLVKKIKEILEISHCSLILLNLEKKIGTVTISHEDPDFESVDISLEHYPEILRSLQTAAITIVKNPSNDPLMNSLKANQLKKVKDVSIMVLPLLFEEKVFSVMLVRKQQSEEGFTIREVRICQLMVNIVLLTLQRICNAHVMGLPGNKQQPALHIPIPEESSEGNSFYSTFFLCSPVGVLLLDTYGSIKDANPKAIEFIGISKQKLLTLQYQDIVPKERIDEIQKMRKNSFPDEVFNQKYHIQYQPPEGQLKTFSVEHHSFLGDERYSLVFFRDVSKEKQLEEELNEQTKKLTEANKNLHEARASLINQNEELLKTNDRLIDLNRMKTHFLAVGTHEIRTPLSIIMGYNRLLLQEKIGTLNSEQKNILNELVQSCERLLNIVNEMLDFSRIDSGDLKLKLSNVDIRSLLDRVYRQMEIISNRADIELLLNLPEDPIIITHDSDRIEQVLVNLLSNAIKFTSSGGTIALSANTTDEGGKKNLRITVADNGAGFPKSIKNKIFNGFKVDPPNVGGPLKQKGVGLGLAISKRIVKAHGGNIRAESKEGEGAVFTFTLPFVKDEQTK